MASVGKDKPLKAYVVREDSEGNCAIVFAINGASARREGGNELNLSFEEVESCCREPAFDQFAPGPVPIHATLAAGWWHECAHCGVRFDEEGRNDYDSDEERDDPFEPVQDSKQINYCSPTCMMEEWAKRRQEKAREHAVIEAALIKWPEALLASAGRYSRGWPLRGDEWRAAVTLPELKYPVTWAPGSADAFVSQCDLEAFNRLYGVKEEAQKGGA